MKAYNQQQHGFTLIELMIVIAIVGILAAIALPAYQDYIVRSKMTEPLAILAETKTTVAEYVSANGKYPDNVDVFGLATEKFFESSDIVAALSMWPIEPEDGEPIYIGVGVFTSVWEGGEKDIDSIATFQLSGSTNADGTMTWECIPGYASGYVDPVPNQYLPANCRG